MPFKRLVFFLLALFFVSAAEAKRLQPVTLQLQWKHQFQFAGYYMAKEKGFYEAAGLDVRIYEYEEGINVVEGVRKRWYDFGSGRVSLILDRDKNLMLMAAIYQSSPFIFLARARDDLQTVKDFNNKKIMLSDSLVDTASLFAMIKSQGLRPYDYIVLEHSLDIRDLINGKADIVSAYISNEPYLLRERNISYTIFDPRSYGFDFYGDILFTSRQFATLYPEVTKKFYEATLKGWEYAFSHIDETIDMIYQRYNSLGKSKEALRYEAETLKKLAYRKGVAFGTLDPNRLREIANTYRLLGITDDVDTDFSDMLYQNSITQMHLTPKEERYLSEHAPLKVCVNPDWMPFEKIENDTYIGIGSSIFELLGRQLGQSFLFLPYTRDMENNATCDLFSFRMIPDTEPLSEDMTQPVLRFPLAVATTVEKSYMADLSGLEGKRVAMKESTLFAEMLRKQCPGIRFVTVSDAEEGLQMVLQNQVYGYIDLLPVLNYHIRKYYTGSLKVNGVTESRVAMTLVVSKHEQPLLHIMQKALGHITPAQKSQILNTWLQPVADDMAWVRTLIPFAIAVVAVLIFLGFKYILSVRENRVLQKSLDSFKTLMESTIEGIIIFDQKGYCIQTNHVAEAIFGYRREEMAGMHATSLMCPESADLIKEHMRVKNQSPYEAKLLRKDGTCIVAILRGRDMIWNDQPIRVSTVIDISEMKKLQEDLEQLNKNLEEKVRAQVEDIRQKDQMLLHQSKLASMGEMIGAIAHQWRQPLNALNINIQNLDDDYADGLIDDLFIEDFIRKNSQIITFMSKTIDDFRNFFRIDKVKESFSVKEAVEATVSMQAAQLKNRSIEVVIEGEDIFVTGYRHEFQQVLLNLINNASDVLKNREQTQKQITIRLQETMLSIEDNGGGVDPKIMDRIFEPYFTTKSQGEGTGLGLYMSKVIIEKNMGGKLEVRNWAKGAVFEICFPKAAIVHLRRRSVPALES